MAGSKTAAFFRHLSWLPYIMAGWRVMRAFIDVHGFLSMLNSLAKLL